MIEKNKRRKKKIKSIKFRQSLFWDVDPKTIDPKKHAKYIIERVLDFGNDKEVREIWERYPHLLIRDVVRHSRVLHPQTRVFWEALTKK